MRRLVMAVVVAERHGLHAAATGFACANGLPEGVRRCRAAALAVEQATLATCLSGATYGDAVGAFVRRSEEHTSELQSRPHLVCRLLLEKKKIFNSYFS